MCHSGAEKTSHSSVRSVYSTLNSGSFEFLSKREHLLNEIQKQAEEIQKLMAKLAKLEEANKQKNTLHLPAMSETSSMASPPILSPSSTQGSPYFSSDLTPASQTSPEVAKDMEDWIGKARESLAEFGGFIGIGGGMPKSYIVEQDPEGDSDSGSDSEVGHQEDSQNDGEYEFAVVDDEGEEWSPQDPRQKRAPTRRLSGSSAGSHSGSKQAGRSVTIPSEAVPFGLLAGLAYKNQTKRQSSSEVEMDEPETETGVANADFFRPSTLTAYILISRAHI